MSDKKINIGEFSWDDKAITEQITINIKRINDLKDSLSQNAKKLKENSKEFGVMDTKIDSQLKKREKLKKNLDEGILSQEEYNKKIRESNITIEGLQNRQAKLGEQQSSLKTRTERFKNEVKALNTENKELNGLLISQNSLSKTNLENYQAENKSINQLRAEKKDLIKLRNAENGATEESRNMLLALNNAIEKNTQAQKANVSENEKRFFQVGQYKEAINSATSDIYAGLSKMASGDVKAGFSVITNGFKEVAKSAKALYASLASNPLTATIAVIGALGVSLVVAGKEVYAYNKKIAQQLKFLEDKFGDLGDNADELRIKIEGVSKAYSIDFKRITDTVDAISSSGLASEIEAIEAIKKGLSTAPNADEYLSKMENLASKARQIGISLTQVANLSKALQGTAIDPNTIIGGLEKASNRLQSSLKENKGLVKAFGESFAKDLLSQVQSGSITTVEALELIRKKNEEVGVSMRDQAALGKDLFGKLAGNAGAYREMLRLVGEANKDQFSDLTQLQRVIKDIADQEEELERAKNQAMKSDAVMALRYEFEELKKKIQIAYYTFISWIKKVDREFLASSEYMRGVFKAIPREAQAAFSSVVKALGEMIKGFKSGFKAVGEFMKGNFDSAQQEATKFIKTFPPLLGKLKQSTKGFFSGINTGGKELANKFREEYDMAMKAKAEIQKKLDEKKKPEKTPTDPPTKDKNNVDKNNKRLEEEAKKALEIARVASEQSITIAKNELAEYIRVNAAKLKDDKRLTEEKLQLQEEYLQQVLEKQRAINLAEQSSKDLAIQQKIEEIQKKTQLNQNELNEIKNLKTEIEILNQEYANKDIELVEKFNEQKQKINKAYEDQLNEDRKLFKAMEFQQRLIDLENEGATEYEAKQLQMEEQRQNDLNKLEDDRQNGLISLDNYESKKKLIEDKYRSDSDKLERAKRNAILASYGEMFGGISKLLGENTKAGKVAALAQVGISQGLVISRTWEEASLLPQPFSTINRVVQTGVAIAQVLKAARQINSVKAQRGMVLQGPSHTGGGIPISTPRGMIEAEGGEVIINKNSSRIFRKELSAINVAGGGVKFGAGGITPTSAAVVQRNITESINFEGLKEMLIEATYQGTANGARVGSQDGIKGLSEERSIQYTSEY